MVAWGRRSCFEPAEISFFVYLVQFKDEGCRVSLKLHLFVSDGDSGNEDFICKRMGAKIFLRGLRDRKFLLRFPVSC